MAELQAASRRELKTHRGSCKPRTDEVPNCSRLGRKRGRRLLEDVGGKLIAIVTCKIVS